MNQAILQTQNAISQLIPELILVVAACVHFLAGPFLESKSPGRALDNSRHRWGAIALFALVLASVSLLVYQPQGGLFLSDSLAWLIRFLSLFTGMVLLLIGWNVDDDDAAEHHACLLLIIAGVNITAMANDLVLMFLGLELVSIPTYLLLYIGRRSEQGAEATIKYFLLSVFSSAVLLFGFSYLYGITGTTNLTSIHAAIADPVAGSAPSLLKLALILTLVGLGFRLTVVPFHFYAPDVLQGVSVTGAALLSFIPKVAGLVALVRLLMLNPAVMPDGGWQTMEMTNLMIGVLAVASMTIGNMLALQQHDIRRLLAWSSVAHGGYLLVGLAVAGKAGAPVDPVAATLFYLVAYGAMTVGAFAVLGMLERREQRIERIDELAGLGHSVPGVALMMALFLFSLTGLPPTAGFLGKWNLFLAAWSSAGQMGRMLAIAMAVNAAIGAWYYLRVIGVMYLEPTPRGSHSVRLPSLLAGISCCAATIAFFLVPGWLWQLVG